MRTIFHSMKNLIILSTLSSLSLSSMAAWTPYTVKEGDQLGKLVLSRKFNLPLWGTEGSVAKVFAKNQPMLKNANKIYVGQSILLPETQEDFQAKQLATSDTLKVIQASVEKKDVSEKKGAQGEPSYTPAKLSIGGAFSVMNFDLEQSNLSSSLESDPIFGVVAQGEFPMSESLFLDLGFSYRKIKFKAPEGKSLSSDGGSFYNFSFGAVKHWSRVSFGAGFQLEQSPLAVELSSVAVAMRTFQIFSPYLKTRFNFFSREKTKLSLELMGLYNMPSSKDRFDLDSGYNAALSFDIERSLSKNSSLSVVPFVNYGKKELGTLTQKGTDSGLKVIYNLLD